MHLGDAEAGRKQLLDVELRVEPGAPVVEANVEVERVGVIPAREAREESGEASKRPRSPAAAEAAQGGSWREGGGPPCLVTGEAALVRAPLAAFRSQLGSLTYMRRQRRAGHMLCCFVVLLEWKR